jgi:S1-C subfamily serine protease
VQAVIEQLLKYGKVEHGVLGVIVQNITPELADALHLKTTKGALISEILPNTPAAAAGLKVEDVITDINNHPVVGADQLKNTMGLIHPGTPVSLTLLRDNQIKTVSATIANPKEIKTKTEPYFAGMRLQNFHEIQGNGSTLQGVLITSLKDSSSGALAGLVLGDVITDVNSKPIASIETLQKAAFNQTKPLMLGVRRGHDNLFLVLNNS